jgi:hypothetical protein
MSMKPQRPKPKLNPRVAKVQDLRRSSAAEPHRNKSRYTRKLKYRDWEYA